MKAGKSILTAGSTEISSDAARWTILWIWMFWHQFCSAANEGEGTFWITTRGRGRDIQRTFLFHSYTELNDTLSLVTTSQFSFRAQP